MGLVLLGLMIFMILGSIVALQMRDLLSSVIAIGVVGLGLSIVFLLLGAPDIAITQVVVEVIIVTVLIRAAAKTGRRDEPVGRRSLPTLFVGAVVLIALFAFTVYAFMALPAFGEPGARPSTWYLANARALTGATNVVTAILLDFRAYDTLGEATVILAAVIGALVILRRPARRDTTLAPPGEGAAAPPAVEAPDAARQSADEEGELMEVGHGH